MSPLAEASDTRVAVYIDFDNIVISRYDQRSRRGQFRKFADYDALLGVRAIAKQVSAPTAARRSPAPEPAECTVPVSEQDAAASLLTRALLLRQSTNDDEWQSSSAIKSQMLRMDPTFQERALGHKSFTEFVQSLDQVVELDEEHPSRRIRIRPATPRR